MRAAWRLASRLGGVGLAGAVGGTVLVAERRREAPLPSVHSARCFGFGGESEEAKKARKRAAVIKKADELYANYLTDNVYNGLRHYKDDGDAEILWRLCRVTMELSKQTRNQTQAAELRTEAFDYLEEAEKHEPPEGIAALHKWKAIMINVRASAQGNRALMETGPTFRAELARAEELDPKDPTTKHIIGQYYFTCADMPGWKRKIATMIWGKLPEGTYEQALEYFQTAEELEPGFYNMNRVWLGKTLLALGREKEAERHFVDVWHALVVTPDDFNAKNMAGEILHRRGLLNKDGKVVVK